MRNCKFCHQEIRSNISCKNCGRLLAEYDLMINSVGVSMTVTSKYLFFCKSNSFGGPFASQAFGGFVGFGLYRNNKNAFTAFGAIDMNTIEHVKVYYPTQIGMSPIIYFKLVNGQDLAVRFWRSKAVDKKSADELRHLLQSLHITTYPAQCYRSDEVKVDHPIADAATLTRSVARSAAQFIEPFDDMIVLDI